MTSTGWALLAVAAVVLLAAGAWVAMRRRARRGSGRSRPNRASFSPGVTQRQKSMVVILNPTKVDDVAAVQSRIKRVTDELGWQLEVVPTTPEQTGTEQAHRAVGAAADVVCALGGDGTVRAVASGLVGSRTPLGILPAGTGNLLARNIGLPVGTLEDAVRVAATGENLHLDVGRIRTEGGDVDPLLDHYFLVLAGMGFDAAVMDTVGENLKSSVGWSAYLVSGVRHLIGERFSVTLTPSDGAAVERKARSVLIGNCGRLVAGVALIPEARYDDGLLDTMIVAPRGLPGWVGVGSAIVRRKQPRGEAIERHTAPGFRIEAGGQQPVQLDGDFVGTATVIEVEAWPRALIVRAPAGVVRR